jgi:hypothetical protein
MARHFATMLTGNSVCSQVVLKRAKMPICAGLRGSQPARRPLLDQSLLANAKAIASATGAKVMAQTFNGRVERGRGRAPIA